MGSNGCTADGLSEVKNGTYSTISSYGSFQPTADQLTVIPLPAIFGPLSQIATSPAAQWTVAAGQSLEIDLGFTLDGIVPYADIYVLDDVVSGPTFAQFPIGAGVSVDTFYCLGTITGGVVAVKARPSIGMMGAIPLPLFPRLRSLPFKKPSYLPQRVLRSLQAIYSRRAWS